MSNSQAASKTTSETKPQPKAQPKAEVKAPKKKEIRCVWKNVWTSEGKLLEGDTCIVPTEEADELVKAGKAEEV